LYFAISLDRFTEIVTSRPEEVIALTKRHSNISTLFYKFRAVKSDSEMMYLNIEWRQTETTIQVGSRNEDLASAYHSFLQKQFQLRNPDPKREEREPKNVQATLFLGRHFDEYAQPLGKKLRRFLELRGFDVKEADAFRSEPIPEKVKELIEQQDIYLGLVTGDRTHDWIIAEAAYAHGQGKHIIFVIEDGRTFNPTLHGRDRERIPISQGRIEESFIPLLEEFNDIRVLGL
jgi:hypothetical protein